MRVTPSSSELPAHPTHGGRRPRRRTAGTPARRRCRGPDARSQAPRHRHRAGVAPGLGRHHRPHRTRIRSTQAAGPGRGDGAGRAGGSRSPRPTPRATGQRAIELPCGRGPIIGVAGQFVQTSVETTVGALLDGEPVPAQPCQSEPITLPAGQQELLISPGAAFVVDGVQLAGPLAGQIRPAATVLAQTGQWSADRREVTVAASEASRVLVVPESINPGWIAHAADGSRLTPVTVNGWQQGWVLPPGTAGRRHADLPVERALPRRAHRRPGAAAGARTAGVRAGAPTPSAG